MRRRLRPLRSQRRARFRLTWPTIVLPVLAVVLLGRGDALRSPLGEREAAIAVAAQSTRGSMTELPATPPTGSGAGAVSTVAAVSLAPRFLTTAESHLRLPGVLVGAAALGAAVVLGERLFATRVGLIAAVLILVLPAGRPILGTQLGGEPFYLFSMLVALAAIRDVSEARISAVVGGIASGAAIAFGGRDGLWLVALALFWLWRNQGLTRRSFTAVAASALLTGVALTLLGLAWLERSAAVGGVLSAQTLLAPQLARTLGGRIDFAWSLAPLLPLAILGLGALPPRWSGNQSVQFLLAWLVGGLANLAGGGSVVPAFVAALYLGAVLIVWGVERSRRVLSLIAVAATIAVAIITTHVPAAARGERSLDRWAVREAGRFLWRTVPAERQVAAASAARGRLAYYGRRAVGVLSDDRGVDDADYIVLRREDYHALRSARPSGGPDVARRQPRFKMVAEFGPWVIARVVRGSAAPPSGAALGSSESTSSSSPQ